MSNIYLKKKNKKILYNLDYKNKIYSKNIDKLGYTKYFLPSNKEWYSNIYAYNNNYIKNLPRFDKMVIAIIRSFFNLHFLRNKELLLNKRRLRIRLHNKRRLRLLLKRIKIKRRIRIKWKRSSTNRILLSKPEIKHTNTKAIITVYVYNAEKRFLINKLKKIDFIRKLSNKRIRAKILKINKKAFILINLIKKIFYRLNLIKLINWNEKKNFKIDRKKNINRNLKRKIKLNRKNKLNKKIKLKRKFKINRILYKKIKMYKKISIFMKKKFIKAIPIYNLILKKLIKKSLKRERLRIFYKHLVWFNKSKFENTYLYPLSKLLSSLYKKKIEFNFINLKRLHLNSSILSQFITIKLKNRKNRLWRVLKKFFKKLKLKKPKKEFLNNRFSYLDNVKKIFYFKAISKSNLFTYKYLYVFYLMKKTSEKNIKQIKSDILNQLIQIGLDKHGQNPKIKRLKKKLKKNIKILNFIKTSKKLKQLNKTKDKKIFKQFKLVKDFNKIKQIKKLKLECKKNYIDMFKNLKQNLINIKTDKNKNKIKNMRLILNSIKHKSISGVRLDVSGRLSRRFVAARSVSYYKYKGSLKDINSSYGGNPTVMLRGHLKSNIQYTKLSSKIRIGSFGVKGWISTFI